MKNVILLLAIVSCSNGTWAKSEENTAIVPIEGRPDARREEDARVAKEALHYLLHNHAIPLSVHPSCSNVGMRDDKTIGDLTSNMFSQSVNAKGKSSPYWINASCKDSPQPSQAGPVRDCEITFYQARLGEYFFGGRIFNSPLAKKIRFSAQKNSSAIIRKTILCAVEVEV